MHDINLIRENPEEFDAQMKRRDVSAQAKNILELDKVIRAHKGKLQEVLQTRNGVAKEIGHLKSMGEDATHMFKKAEEIKQQVIELENKTDEEIELEKILLGLPNILDADIPPGKGEEENVEIKKWGEVKDLGFKPKDHVELGEKLGMMDFTQTAKISGSRFVTLSKDLAKLERALASFMLDVQTNEYGMEEISPPLLVNESAMYGTNQLPKFEEDAFVTTDGKWLISTSEIALANLVREKILKEDELPKRFCAYTPCFRSEAGAAGKDTRGMIRLHQFNKVEMVAITKPENSEKEHERLLSIAEDILQKLELPYRVTLLCSGDTGFGAKKTYDLETWLPSQNCYREISSVSNCGDFQARRMKARYRDANRKNTFIHTLNGSGLAVGRTLVAILENYQNKDGSITVPQVLQTYMGGKELLAK
jgi:seryl-tRNA synthetase